MFKFLALVTLVVAASATSTGFESIFAQQPENQFGQAINSMIQMSVQDNAGRLQEISDLLYELQAILDQQQADADTHIEQYRAQCEAQIPAFQKQLDDLRANVQDATEEQSSLQEEQSNKNTLLGNEQINYESTSNDLTQAQSDLEEESSSFSEYSASFDDAILACEEAIRLMTQLATGSTSSFVQRNKNSGLLFVQLSQRFNDVKGVLENHIKKGGPAAFVQPVIDILSELSSETHVDAGKVQQIIELIQTLLNRLREGLYQRTEQNTKTQNDLTALIASLVSAQQNSGTQISILETRLSEIQTRLDELVGVVSNLQDLLVVQEQLVANTQADCNQEEVVYNSETQQRTSNLALLDQLIQHFETQVTSTVENISDSNTLQ